MPARRLSRPAASAPSASRVTAGTGGATASAASRGTAGTRGASAATTTATPTTLRVHAAGRDRDGQCQHHQPSQPAHESSRRCKGTQPNPTARLDPNNAHGPVSVVAGTYPAAAQCDMSTGTVIDPRISLETPPQTSCEIRGRL